MGVPGYVWLLTVVGIVAMLVFDFVFHVRKAHTPTLKESAVWSSVYVGIAVLFGLGVWILGGTSMGTEYFAGYVTEKALSVDNLFVFLIIMTSFAVPRADQQKVLLFGIVFSLIARTGFIFIGAALISQFAWVFYLFGLILLLTAGHMLKPEGEDSHAGDNIMVRIAQKLFRTTDRYDGDKLVTIEDGKKVLTPMVLVMAAIGGTDILFALDSIPAIYGLTRERLHRLHRDRVLPARPAAAVLPHRRPVGPAHLPQLRACRDPRLHRSQADPARPAREQRALHQWRRTGQRRRDQHRALPQCHHRRLLVTVIASLISPRAAPRTPSRMPQARYAVPGPELRSRSAAAGRRHSRRCCEEERIIRGLPEKYRRRIRDEHELMGLLRRAHAVKDQRVAAGYGSAAAKADG